jgi:hypothetical protein
MTSFMMLLLMQYVISTKAGLVNHVQGAANVTSQQLVQAGQAIRTGLNGFVEVLLTPGSFLRVGENSEVVLDGVELTDVAVRIVSGSAIVEAAEMKKETPIRVTTGNLRTELVETGIYRFSDGKATVLDGKLQTADSKIPYKKGWQVFYQDAYRAVKLTKIETTSLDVFSQNRSALIARVNASAYNSLVGTNAWSSFNIWLFSPVFGAFTYIPGTRYRSPYGYRYYGAYETAASRVGTGVGGYDSSSSGGQGNVSASSPSSAGGGIGGGGAGRTVQTPNSTEGMTRGEYIRGKAGTAPAPAPQ